MISREFVQRPQLSEFMRFLANLDGDSDGRLPPLIDLSRQLGISVATLREQMEVARALGLIEVKPRTGIRRLKYEFRPAVRQTLEYALAVDPTCFEQYADLRTHIEAAYFPQAASLLTAEDHQELLRLTVSARERLKGYPVQIPHSEHRQLHLLIYRRLANLFVNGILEAYWEAYEEAGLDLYTDYNYLEKVWQFHSLIIEAIVKGDITGGHRLLIEHMGLLQKRKSTSSRHTFE